MSITHLTPDLDLPTTQPAPRAQARHHPLLVCGVLASLLYLAMNVLTPLLYEGYSSLSQTISELSAIDAPTRSLWVPLGFVYSLLVVGFGWAIWSSAERNRALRIAGALMFANGLISLYWPPMHMRGAEPTLTDTLHIIYSVITVLLMMLAIGFAAAAFGRRFRAYSIATVLILLAFGALTGMDGPRIAANLPTPWIGLWERISVGAFMVWMLVFASVLMARRTESSVASANR